VFRCNVKKIRIPPVSRAILWAWLANKASPDCTELAVQPLAAQVT